MKLELIIEILKSWRKQMKTYNDLYNEFDTELNEKYNILRKIFYKIDDKKIQRHYHEEKYFFSNTTKFTDILEQDGVNLIEVNNQISELKQELLQDGYRSITVKQENFVDGTCDNYDDIEINSVEILYKISGIKLIDKKIEPNEKQILFKYWLMNKIEDKYKKLYINIDCKILELFKDNIINYEKFIELTMGNCKS